MTYNLRYGLANDGVNSWENRRELLIESIRAFDPDVLGTQECLSFQADFLCERLPDYKLIGVGRLDGRRDGELNAVLYRTARLEPLDSGTFWLSETPDRPGSRGWDAELPRIVTWAKFYDVASEQALVCVNTHWDHLGHQAKLESARLMRRWLVERTQGLATIVTGDFNIDVDSVPFHLLSDGEPKLIDAYRAAHPEHEREPAADGTFHGFSGEPMPDRIDWILATPSPRIERCEIDRFNRDGQYPSDHFPVEAVLRVS
jgi:endonuclease/exonuclease/phosphatase family metal-dependent hydrolase